MHPHPVTLQPWCAPLPHGPALQESSPGATGRPRQAGSPLPVPSLRATSVHAGPILPGDSGPGPGRVWAWPTCLLHGRRPLTALLNNWPAPRGPRAGVYPSRAWEHWLGRGCTGSMHPPGHGPPSKPQPWGTPGPLPVARPALWGPCRSQLKRPSPQLPAECPEDQSLCSLGLGSAQSRVRGGWGGALARVLLPGPLSRDGSVLPQCRSKGIVMAAPTRPSATGRLRCVVLLLPPSCVDPTAPLATSSGAFPALWL